MAKESEQAAIGTIAFAWLSYIEKDVLISDEKINVALSLPLPPLSPDARQVYRLFDAGYRNQMTQGKS